MIRLAEAPVATAAPPIPPRWAAPRHDAASTAEAAFLAGAALNALDQIVRAAPPWAGAWRRRLALNGAAAAVRRLGLKEDEAELRDAWHLRAAGADPGPAGRVYGAWRLLAAQPVGLDERGLETIAGALGTPWSAALAAISAGLTRVDRPAPFAAAAIIADALSEAPNAELLAWWAADVAVARAMRWPIAVPLLMGQFHTDAFRANGRGRISPGGEAFERAMCLALAKSAREACRLAADMARRAERLIAAAPKLRAKGAGAAIQLLLDDDAVSGSLTTPMLSRFAARRLFDRLTALDAVRELSGRPAFRLYGL
jgi:hypothetical protein